MEIEKSFKLAKNLVLKSGQIMRQGFLQQKEVKQKRAFFDLVTVYDKQIEDLLINGIREEFPHHKFIGEEESAERNAESALTDDPTWIIDPIDGTTNFIRKIPHACISIGLAVRKQMVIGIVYNPMLNELFTAKRGEGAFLNGERLRVTDCKHINNAVVGYEISLIHDKTVRDKNVKRIYKLASNATGTRCFGSAALSLCYVASGQMDAYHVEDLKSWDVAAGAIIIEEAGGVVKHTTGGTFDVMKPDLVAASTEELCQNVVGLIKEANAITEYVFQ